MNTLSPKTSFANIIVYFIIPLRVLTDALPLFSTLINFFLLFLLMYDFCSFAISKKKLKLFSWILNITLIGVIIVWIVWKNYFYPFRGVIRYSTYVLLFYFFSRHYFDEEKLYSIFSFLMFCQVVVSLFQIFIVHKYAANGTLQNRNHVCYFTSFYMAITLFHHKNLRRTLVLYVFELFLGGIGGVLSATGVLFFYFVFEIKGRIKILSIIVFLLLVVLGLYVMRGRLIEQILSISEIPGRIKRHENAGGGSSFLWRVITWYKMINQMHIDSRIGIGAGIDYASLVSPYFCTASHLDPHNDYVRIYINEGFVGLGLFIYGVFSSYRRLQLKKTNSLGKAIKYFFFTFLICMLVANLVPQSTLLWIFFIYLGIYYYNNEGVKNEKLCNCNSCKK